jgi:hypothetical protein
MNSLGKRKPLVGVVSTGVVMEGVFVVADDEDELDHEAFDRSTKERMKLMNPQSRATLLRAPFQSHGSDGWVSTSLW